MNPRISIAIPVYNTEKYIRRCIESVLNQSLNDIEIVIVDDCTPDNAMKIVEEYQKKDKRIKIFRHTVNQGLMCARRTGYQKSTGAFVTFLDSDDELAECSLEKLYNAAIETNSDVVAGNLEYIKTTGRDNDLYKCTLKYGSDRISAIKSTLLWEMTHNLCGKLFKKELFDNYQFITKEHMTIGEDGMLFYQLLDKSSHISCINQTVYYYYQNNDSSTQIKYGKHQLASLFCFLATRYDIVKKYKELVPILNYSTIKKLCGLCGNGYNKNQINNYLNNTSIPFKLNANSIIKFSRNFFFIKGIIQVYLLNKTR